MASRDTQFISGIFKLIFRRLSVLVVLLFSLTVFASEEDSEIESCIVNMVLTGEELKTVQTVRDACRTLTNGVQVPDRVMLEQLTAHNRFVITPHRQNYILPYTYNSRPNDEPFRVQNAFPGVDAPVLHEEAKLQLSLKVPLNTGDIFFERDGIYAAFTMTSFWQVYNAEVSKPFRETNYRPEIFYQAPISSPFLGGTVFTRVGFEHESNGRSQYLSRSWNRIYAGLGFQRNRWALYLQPWYRIPEDVKEDDGDPLTPPAPDGDDNPDIDDYLGHYEFISVYSLDDYEVNSMIRHNFDTGKEAVEIGMSFPLWGRLKGYIQYFNGYGESMIDYNHRVKRIGVGLLLTDLL